MLEVLSRENIPDKIAINKNATTRISSGVLFNLISLSTNAILKSQERKAIDVKKKSKYCLLNSKTSNEKGNQNKGIRKTNK